MEFVFDSLDSITYFEAMDVKRHLAEGDTMTLSHCFNIRSFILAAALISDLGLVNHANAQRHSYLVDLNTKAVTPLGTLGGDGRTGASDINDAGQVVGFSTTMQGDSHAYITGPNGDGMRDLGTFSGGDYSYALGINNAGQVVGWADTATEPTHAFITGPDGAGMRALGTGYSHATKINEAGQVAGASRTTIGEYHAFITGPGGMGMRYLGTLGGEHSSPEDINNTGQVVGEWRLGEAGVGTYHAFITGPDGVGMKDPGILGGDISSARGVISSAQGINDAGQVVGVSYTAEGTTHAFITDPDGMGMRDLGTLGGSRSYAYDINEAGQVVGTSMTATGDWHAFITGPDGMGMINLNLFADLPERTILTHALGINNNGQVIAMGVVPEPETYALILVGLGLVGWMVRRKRAEVRI
ncbi:HAF repeat-containing PEP-CTERM protein [Nitrosovibrio sp. Nv6]|uniref:HAF repeat-containing PEP-CTERM protein n=1 Tax=Nitrosovibrio sp. Nv6 TaxID=1855340 RepID=UPI0008BB0507|nr:HAF repeat-containing PEP-CTERM protein [Nitrosovibrio sp. Nv6]SEO58814.1 PEP-CTERM protein-sorting domain-containing protein [Nitrosovibrio sp. Nv6]